MVCWGKIWNKKQRLGLDLCNNVTDYRHVCTWSMKHGKRKTIIKSLTYRRSINLLFLTSTFSRLASLLMLICVSELHHDTMVMPCFFGLLKYHLNYHIKTITKQWHHSTGLIMLIWKCVLCLMACHFLIWSVLLWPNYCPMSSVFFLLCFGKLIWFVLISRGSFFSSQPDVLLLPESWSLVFPFSCLLRF